MRILTIGIVISMVIVAFFAGYTLHTPPKAIVQKDISKVSQIREGGYQFISPLLECEYDQATGRAEFTSLDQKITTYIEDAKSAGKLSTASVYYRDLNNGPWFGVNIRESFSPASLLKLPVMMAYYKAAEKNPSILSSIITYKGKEDDQRSQNIITGDMQFEKGKQYSIQDVIKYMMVNSSNVALSILGEHIDSKLIDKVITDLDLVIPNDPQAEDYMTTRSYSSLFRVLYNASYLNKEYSEMALSVMSQSAFTDGLVAGLPANTKISHKFGERLLDNGIRQLHDCGIVYPHRTPYLICIMTRGKDFGNLSKIIADISRITYQEHIKE